MATSRRSSTGRSRRSAIRWPIWPTASTRGSSRATSTGGGSVRPTALPGFCGRQELLDRYAERTNADLSQIEYYRCFNHWKTVCILQGVYARYPHGQKDTEGVDMSDFRRRMMQSLEQAAEAAACL